MYYRSTHAALPFTREQIHRIGERFLYTYIHQRVYRLWKSRNTLQFCYILMDSSTFDFGRWMAWFVLPTMTWSASTFHCGVASRQDLAESESIHTSMKRTMSLRTCKHRRRCLRTLRHTYVQHLSFFSFFSFFFFIFLRACRNACLRTPRCAPFGSFGLLRKSLPASFLWLRVR